MRKRSTFLLMVLFSLFILSSCGSKGTGSSAAPKEAEKPLVISEKQEVKDYAEFTLEKVEFTQKVTPPKTSGFYTFYEAKKEGTELFHAVFKLKNLSTSNIGLEDATKLTLDIDNQKYTTNVVVEDEGGADLRDALIAPVKSLNTATVHYFVEVPKDSQGKEIKYQFEINKAKYAGTFQAQDFVAKKEMVKLGDKLKSDGYAEVALKGLVVTKKFEPSKPGSFHTYYEPKDSNKTYIVLKTDVKNLKSSGLGADEIMGVKLTYNDKYEYDSFAVVEESDGSDFTYANITNIDPLTTVKVHYLFEVPSEVAQGKVEIEIYLNGKTVYLNK